MNDHSTSRSWLPGDERRQLILDAARRAFSRRGDVGPDFGVMIFEGPVGGMRQSESVQAAYLGTGVRTA